MKWFKRQNFIVKSIIIVALLFIGSAVVAGTYSGLTMSDDEREALKEEKENKKQKKSVAKEEKETKNKKKENDKPEKSKKEDEKGNESKDKEKDEKVNKRNKDNDSDKKSKENKGEDSNGKKESTWDDLKNKNKLIGKSDKDYSEVSKQKPSKVRDDKTGNWRVSTISENIDIEDYALSYKNSYMGEGEIHFIVNFNRNTTTWLSEMNGLLHVEIREYVDKEEHSANELGSGMTLKSYTIYPDGDIEEMDI